ncbi:MAG: NAD-dependent epimerase/dehydratase family protein [Moraxella sp.]|nr:NAD-dependent epimerase/dehydratase family protein [Moraxella sp.]
MNTYLIIGQGDIGLPVALRLAAQGHRVSTVARTPKHYPTDAITFWQKDALDLTRQELEPFSHIAIIITPTTHPDRVQAYKDSYLAVCQHIANNKSPNNLKQLLFVSSTSVYGENAGESIDEHTPVCPNDTTASILHQAEQTLQDAFGDKCTIVRPSGIYGKARTRMIRLAQSAHQDGVPSSHFTNRIMDTDLVAVLVQVMQLTDVKAVYLATDFEPVPSAKVMTFICQLLACPLPKVVQSPPTGKKITANIERDWLSFDTYQKGYAHILTQNLE